MIPADSITAWGVDRLWPNRAAVEQDLLLARLIVDIYNHAALREELVFRGGTCLHQVHLRHPLRYSEDLDFVRRTHTGIGPIFDAMREVAGVIGLDVRGTDVGQHPKMRLRAPAEGVDGATLRIKLEINTHETSPASPLIRMPFSVQSAWFAGEAEVLTFTTAELVSTKLRAMFQRSKGRDLFDLWLALTHMNVAPRDILASFPPTDPTGTPPSVPSRTFEPRRRTRRSARTWISSSPTGRTITRSMVPRSSSSTSSCVMSEGEAPPTHLTCPEQDRGRAEHG